MATTTLTVNGARQELEVPVDTPLLYVLKNDLGLGSPQFGCGMAQCGACSVLADGREIRSCVTPLSVVAGKSITTLEGLPGRWAEQQRLSPEAAAKTLHPVQQAWIDEQVPMCGFCQNGMMIKAVELLDRNRMPSTAEIVAAFTTDGPSPHLCRCGTYVAIGEAVRRAAAMIAKAK